MSKVVNRFCEEALYFEFEGNTCVAKEREYIKNMFNMFLVGFRIQKRGCRCRQAQTAL